MNHLIRKVEAKVEARRLKKEATKVEGTVILRKAYLFDVKDLIAGLGDKISETIQQKVSFQLVSGDQIDQGTGNAIRSSPADLQWKSASSKSTDYPLESKDSINRITFDWAAEWGTPGAVLVINKHAREFFLKELTIKVPGKADIHFLCNSWIYPKWKSMKSCNFTTERIFFANNSYLPVETPIGLVGLRRAELERLRGDGTGKRKEWDRIYDYDVYNDLCDDYDRDLKRKVLGGSQEFPYPRRCRTGRPRPRNWLAIVTTKLPELPFFKDSFYIPADEHFPQECLSDTRTHLLKSIFQSVIPSIASAMTHEFPSFEHVKNIYSKGLSSLTKITANLLQDIIPHRMIKGILNTDDQAFVKFPVPNIISTDADVWKKDEEFSRQTLSGVNPMVIRCLQSFPPLSNLNAQIYGSRESSITAEHILKHLNGMSVEQATKSKRLFILDYHDAYIPYVGLINNLPGPTRKMYATRTLFFLSDGALKPIAIELCLPPTSVSVASKRVFTPDHSDTEHEWLWELAKAHVRANDSGYHQLVNHWLRTHAVVEPFIIATQRNLSKLHPLHKLLLPHFRNTMHINATARESLINAGGVIENCFTSGKYSMEISSHAYKEWRFNEQGLPADLLKRGVAVPDPTDKANGLRLVIEDYPYAVDGLEIWAALKSWVSDYTALYYKGDQTVQSDTEVQAWWKEIVEVGHGDKKNDERGWYKMNSVQDLKEAITTLIWIASAHHAAVNFGQYGYAGFMPNHPSTTRRLIPEQGSAEYSEFRSDPEAYFLKTVSDPATTVTTMLVLELLSRHSSDEVYLGQGSASKWVDDPGVETAFRRFSSGLVGIEGRINERNKKSSIFKNRRGLAEVPYTLLYPATSAPPSDTRGLTFKGIPNSISI